MHERHHHQHQPRQNGRHDVVITQTLWRNALDADEEKEPTSTSVSRLFCYDFRLPPSLLLFLQSCVCCWLGVRSGTRAPFGLESPSTKQHRGSKSKSSWVLPPPRGWHMRRSGAAVLYTRWAIWPHGLLDLDAVGHCLSLLCSKNDAMCWSVNSLAPPSVLRTIVRVTARSASGLKQKSVTHLASVSTGVSPASRSRRPCLATTRHCRYFLCYKNEPAVFAWRNRYDDEKKLRTCRYPRTTFDFSKKRKETERV